jgi:Uma2 family endonuclease
MREAIAMSQAVKNLTFEEYLNLDAEDWLRLGLPEGTWEYREGELVPLPPESEPNESVADYLLIALFHAGIPFRLIKSGGCEIVVPKVEADDPRTRFPDLVILQPAHLPLIQKRLLITPEMPPPVIVAEVVSPGQRNRKRDYERKRAQYAKRGIPEYWLLDREQQTVTVLELRSHQYHQFGVFHGHHRVLSPTLTELALTAEQVLTLAEERLWQEQRLAEQRAAQERLGAEQAEQQAAQERLRAAQAEQERQQAAQERHRAAQSEQQAAQAEQRSQQLAEHLRQLGINPDEI